MEAPALELLRRERDRFVGFAFSTADLLLELDATCRVKWSAGAVRSILGADSEKLPGEAFSRFLPPHDDILVKSALRDLGQGQRLRDVDLTLLSEPDRGRRVRTCMYRSLASGDPIYLLSMSLRVEDMPASGSVNRDALTGLLDAVDFTRATQNAVRAARNAGKSACLTLVQICGTAELGKLLGPQRADALVAEIGSRLRLHAVGTESAAQLGDGRFAVTHFEKEDSALISESLSRLGQDYELALDDLKLSETTVDLHVNSLADSDVENILTYILDKFRAEGAAVIGQGSAEEYFRRMTAETLSRVVMMRDVIHERRLSLHYQPIVALADRAVHHYEVLLRFADGRSPFDDIVFAEQTNTIHEVDLAVTQGAVLRLQEAIAGEEPLSLAVNMSARSLLNDRFLDMFDELADKIGQGRHRLIVEITESAKLEDLARAASAVARLAKKGHPICLDDFGAGASSLPYLQKLEVGYVKIDGAYIRGITEGNRERAIIRGVLATCRTLDVKTVAEMIEREDQHESLSDLGVDFGQGWLYGRPTPDIAKSPARASGRIARKLDPKAISRMLVKGKP
ncbi:MAG TPA: EAL domain-containing protein [Dongiaceae bacterium]|jgi:EAL domain-containing protein (putative c-di-GMP-specific phosphodiesterase class I)